LLIGPCVKDRHLLPLAFGLCADLNRRDISTYGKGKGPRREVQNTGRAFLDADVESSLKSLSLEFAPLDGANLLHEQPERKRKRQKRLFLPIL